MGFINGLVSINSRLTYRSMCQFIYFSMKPD